MPPGKGFCFYENWIDLCEQCKGVCVCCFPSFRCGKVGGLYDGDEEREREREKTGRGLRTVVKRLAKKSRKRAFRGSSMI